MLEMRQIDKRFDAVVALDGANLVAKPGRIMALLGSNGSGKSTLMKILGGLVYLNKGEIFVDNKRLKIRNSYDSISNGIAKITVFD